MHALKIDVDGTITDLELPTDGDYLPAIQDAAGGWVEYHTIGKNMTLWLDEDAPAKNVAVNDPVDSMIRRALGVYLNGRVHGPAVITGGTTGNVRGLIDDEVNLIRERITGTD